MGGSILILFQFNECAIKSFFIIKRKCCSYLFQFNECAIKRENAFATSIVSLISIQ